MRVRDTQRERVCDRTRVRERRWCGGKWVSERDAGGGERERQRGREREWSGRVSKTEGVRERESETERERQREEEPFTSQTRRLSVCLSVLAAAGPTSTERARRSISAVQ